MNARRESLFTRPKRSCFQSLPVIRSHGVCSAQCEGSRPFRLKAFAAVQAALPFWTELLIQQISEQSFAPPPRSAWMRCCSPHLLRSALQACNKGQHGHGVSDSVGKIAAGRGRNRFGRLKALRFRLAATALKNDSVSIDDPRLAAEPRLAVVMGTEGTGLEQSAIDACDYTVMIPMHHGVDSLNVAAASAVAFWQLGRRTENRRNNADCNKND